MVFLKLVSELNSMICCNYRTSISVLICILSMNVVNSQNLGVGENPHWTYSFNGSFSYGKTEVTFLYDSIGVDLDTVSVYERRQMTYWPVLNDSINLLIGEIYIRKDSLNKYYISYDGTGYNIFMDFTLDVNDSYTIYNPDDFSVGSDSAIVTILGYGDTLIDGYLFDYQSILYEFDSYPFELNDILVKDIGGVTHYINIFDIFLNEIGGGEGGPLICYDDGVLEILNDLPDYFVNEISDNCLIFLSYEDLNFKEDVIIYPNPVIDELNIEFSVNRTNYEVKIINYLGNEVYNVNHAYSNGRILINLSKLVTGIYYVCLGNTVHKIVKF